MSSMVMIQPLLWGLMYLDVLFTGVPSGLSTWLGSMLLDLGVMRPSSRQQESEADHVGLMLMAQSCYDPKAAVGLWQRMEMAENAAPPEWMSTHPSVSLPLKKRSLSCGFGNFVANYSKCRTKTGSRESRPCFPRPNRRGRTVDVLLLRVILRISEELYRTLFGSGMIFSFPSALNLTEGTYRKETRCQWFSVYSIRMMRLARLFSVRIKAFQAAHR
jgi:hypothetical protein